MTEANKPPNSPERTGTEDMVMFGHYVLALIDFLGQASELTKWAYPPNTLRPDGQVVQAVQKTFGRILVWRGEFEKRFHDFRRWRQLPQEDLSQLPNGGEELRRFQETTLGFSHFSDSVVVYSPVENQHGYQSVGNVSGFLVACGSLLLAGFCQGTVFRGAIEIGMAGRFPQADLYGPVLAKAHHLESKVAQYPRIVVGPTLVDFLQTYEHNPEDSGSTRANRQSATMCLKLLSQDDDECWIVDYLGDEFANLGGNPDEWVRLRQSAVRFVEEEHQRFKRENNGKLAERYGRLLAYFRSRGCNT